MIRHMYMIKVVALVMLCIITTGCHKLWMDKTGILSARVSDVTKSDLHDIYTLMLTNGYQMKKAESTDISVQEDWKTLDWGMTGRFKDLSYPSLAISFIYTEEDKRLLVICNEIYSNKHGFVQTGFSTEGQSRADKVILSIKRRFGDAVKIVQRTYYTGSH